MPLFYYHAPSATGVNRKIKYTIEFIFKNFISILFLITVDMVEFFEKVKHNIPSLGGIKFASTSFDELSQAYRAAGDRYRVIVSNNYVRVFFIHREI